VGLLGKRLGLQFVLIYFVELLRTSQAVQFQTAFLLINSIVHAIVDKTFNFLEIPGFREFAKYGE